MLSEEHLSRILSYSKEHKELFEEIEKSLKEIKGSIEHSTSERGIDLSTSKRKRSAVLYGLGDPRQISFEEVYQLISEDEYGNRKKSNIEGSRTVLHIGRIYFKIEPEFPLIEQASYLISQFLGGGIIAPSHLLVVEIPIGDKGNKKRCVSLLASLEVQGIKLNKLLRIRSGIIKFKSSLGGEILCRDYLSLANGSYYQEWLQKNGYTDDMPWQKQLRIFQEQLLKLHSNGLPKDLQDVVDFEKELHEIFDDDPGLRQKSPLALLAFIKWYPKLCSSLKISEISFYLDIFADLFYLFPKDEPHIATKKAENLLDYFDNENLSKHLLLTLLTEPSDQKGDNFIVKVYRDENGSAQSFHIMGIDNDRAMEGAIYSFKDGFTKKKLHEVLVNSIILILINLTNQRIAPRVRDLFLSGVSEQAFLQLIARLFQYQQYYQSIKTIDPNEFRNMKLDKHIPMGFLERLQHKKDTMSQLFSSNTSIDFLSLFEDIEPILAKFYQLLLTLYPDPEGCSRLLFKGNKPNREKKLMNENILTIEVVLKGQLEKRLKSGEKIGEELQLYSRRCEEHQSYLEVLNKFISDRLLLNYDNKIQSETLIVLAELQGYADFKLSLEDIILSLTSFVKTYEKCGIKIITFLRRYFKNKILRLNESNDFSLTDPSAFFEILRYPSIRSVAVRALLDMGINVNVQRQKDGSTLLHVAATSNFCDVIVVLLQAGVNCEILDHDGNSPLDKAIEGDHKKVIELLLMQGAFQNLKIENRALLIEKYGQEFSNLCRLFINDNPELMWHVTLNSMSQEAATPEKVLILTTTKSERYIRSEVYRKIFGNGKEIPKENEYGNRRVKKISWLVHGVEVGLHLKEYPELPMREIMVHLFAKKLFGFITPFVDLWRFRKNKSFLDVEWKAYPVLATQTIIGDTLCDVLRDVPHRINDLDDESVSKAIILTFLINQEDGRSPNYIIQPFKKQNGDIGFRIVCIDNDHAFVQPVLLGKDGLPIQGPKGLLVKSILFCLEQMKKPMHEKVLKIILEHDPFLLLMDWIKDLKTELERLNSLFNEKDREYIKNKFKSEVENTFKFTIFLDIYQKLIRLQTVLRENPKIELLRLLCQITPELGFRYKESFELYKTPLERFSWLTAGCFKTVKVIKKVKTKDNVINNKEGETIEFVSTTSTSQIKELSGNPYFKSYDNGKALSLDAIEVELKKVNDKYQELRSISNELQCKGESETFKNSTISLHQEWIINGHGKGLPAIDFSAMKMEDGSIDVHRQEKVLNVLQNVRVRKLRLVNCFALTDKLLIEILKTNLFLQSLHIENCPNINDINFISKMCPHLEHLTLINIGITIIQCKFNELLIFIASSCEKLGNILVESSNLQHFYSADCPRVDIIACSSRVLKTFKLINCSEMQTENIKLQFSRTTKLALKNNARIQYAKFYEKYPNLLNISLNDMTSQFVQMLDNELEKLLFNAGGISNELANEICKTVNKWIDYFKKLSLELQNIQSAIESEPLNLETSNELLKLQLMMPFNMPLFKNIKIKELLNSKSLLNSSIVQSDYFKSNKINIINRIIDSANKEEINELIIDIFKYFSDRNDVDMQSEILNIIEKKLRQDYSGFLGIFCNLLQGCHEEQIGSLGRVISKVSFSEEDAVRIKNILLKRFYLAQEQYKLSIVELIKNFTLFSPEKKELNSYLINKLGDEKILIKILTLDVLMAIISPEDKKLFVELLFDLINKYFHEIRVKAASVCLKLPLTPDELQFIITKLLNNLCLLPVTPEEFLIKSKSFDECVEILKSLDLSVSQIIEINIILIHSLKWFGRNLKIKLCAALDYFGNLLQRREEPITEASQYKFLKCFQSSYCVINNAEEIIALQNFSQTLKFLKISEKNYFELISTFLNELKEESQQEGQWKSNSLKRVQIIKILTTLTQNIIKDEQMQLKIINHLQQRLIDVDANVCNAAAESLIQLVFFMQHQVSIMPLLLSIVDENGFNNRTVGVFKQALATLSFNDRQTLIQKLLTNLLDQIKNPNYKFKIKVFYALYKLEDHKVFNPFEKNTIIEYCLTILTADNEITDLVLNLLLKLMINHSPTEAQQETLINFLIKERQIHFLKKFFEGFNIPPNKRQQYISVLIERCANRNFYDYFDVGTIALLFPEERQRIIPLIISGIEEGNFHGIYLDRLVTADYALSFEERNEEQRPQKGIDSLVSMLCYHKFGQIPIPMKRFDSYMMKKTENMKILGILLNKQVISEESRDRIINCVLSSLRKYDYTNIGRLEKVYGLTLISKLLDPYILEESVQDEIFTQVINIIKEDNLTSIFAVKAILFAKQFYPKSYRLVQSSLLNRLRVENDKLELEYPRVSRYLTKIDILNEVRKRHTKRLEENESNFSQQITNISVLGNSVTGKILIFERHGINRIETSVLIIESLIDYILQLSKLPRIQQKIIELDNNGIISNSIRVLFGILKIPHLYFSSIKKRITVLFSNLVFLKEVRERIIAFFQSPFTLEEYCYELSQGISLIEALVGAPNDRILLINNLLQKIRKSSDVKMKQEVIFILSKLRLSFEESTLIIKFLLRLVSANPKIFKEVLPLLEKMLNIKELISSILSNLSIPLPKSLENTNLPVSSKPLSYDPSNILDAKKDRALRQITFVEFIKSNRIKKATKIKYSHLLTAFIFSLGDNITSNKKNKYSPQIQEFLNESQKGVKKERLDHVFAVNKDYNLLIFDKLIQLVFRFLTYQETGSEPLFSANKDYLYSLRNRWQEYLYFLNQFTLETFIQEIDAQIADEDCDIFLISLTATLKNLTFLNYHAKALKFYSDFLDRYSIAAFKKLYYNARSEIELDFNKQSLAELFDEEIEFQINKRMIKQLNMVDVLFEIEIVNEHSTWLRTLFRLALLKVVRFNKNGIIEGNIVRKNIIEGAVKLFCEYWISHDFETLYDNYLKSIKEYLMTGKPISKGYHYCLEVGCLAKSLNVQLMVVTEYEIYRNFDVVDPKLLRINLFQSKQSQWLNIEMEGEVSEIRKLDVRDDVQKDLDHKDTEEREKLKNLKLMEDWEDFEEEAEIERSGKERKEFEESKEKYESSMTQSVSGGYYPQWQQYQVNPEIYDRGDEKKGARPPLESKVYK